MKGSVEGPVAATVKMNVIFMPGHSDHVISGPDHLFAAGTGFLQTDLRSKCVRKVAREA